LPPPVETKVASVQASPSPPTHRPSNSLTTFQRLLIQPFLGSDDNTDSDKE